jgi:TonB family protein
MPDAGGEKLHSFGTQMTVSGEMQTMRIAGASLAAFALLTYTSAAFSKATNATSVELIPLESPASWIASDDYPAVALRYGMTGNTSFKLSVDATGKPSRCDVLESSGFDVLDRATCDRLMANAKFNPPHNRAGQSIESTFSSRVRWVLPEGAVSPISERFFSVLLTIDQAGNATSCRMVILAPAAEAAAIGEKPCGRGLEPPPAMGLAMRAGYSEPVAEVELQQSDVFTPDLRERVLAPKPGYEQRALNVYSITATKDGKIGQCAYIEQRGIEGFATDYCGQARNNRYDPPFSAFDKDGVAHGWHIMRLLLKRGE